MDWGGGSVPIARCLCSCLVAQTVPENNVDFPWNQSTTWDENWADGCQDHTTEAELLVARAFLAVGVAQSRWEAVR